MSLYYDLLIAVFLLVPVAGIFFLWRDCMHAQRWAAKHQKFVRVAIGVCILWFAIIFYGSFIEPRILMVTRTPIELPPHFRRTTPLTVALVSDFHVGPYKKERWVRRVSKKIASLQPDIVLIAGDFFYFAEADLQGDDLAPLRELAHAFPTYAVLGNHEFGLSDPDGGFDYENESARVRGMLTRLGIVVLDNEHVTLSVKDEPFVLGGIREFWTKEYNLNAALPSETVFPRILLAHNPDSIYEAQGRAEVVLAGHTHGGQIALPFVGPLGNPSMRLPEKYFHGVSQWGETTLFVTRGVGESSPRARLLRPPEIALLTIR